MSEEGSQSVTAAFDRQLIWQRGRSVRYLEVDLVSPAVESKRVGPPLNLALVIDSSGSMAGAPLQCAKIAATGVINGLSNQSKISIISFATDVISHISGATLSAEERQRAIGAIDELVTRDSTDLGSGWLRGAECVATVMEKQKGMHNHVLVLSDGHANTGITDPGVLAHHAEQLRSRGVLTSCVGIGNSYSSDQLLAVADHGGGRLHDAEHAHEIIEVVLGELHELQNAIVEDITVTLSFPPGVRVDNLSGFPTVMSSSSALTQLGMLTPNRRRPVVFRITVPDGHPGDVLAFDINCSWVRTGTEERQQLPPLSATLTYATEEQNNRQPRNLDLSTRVSRVWQSAIARTAVILNRKAELRELAAYLDHELKYLRLYCEDLPDGISLVSEVQRMRDAAHRRWDERSRKTIDHAHYMSQQSHSDHRTQQRGKWWTELEP